MASGGPGHDEVARKIEEARNAVRRYREKESPVPLEERNETERIEQHDTRAEGSLLGEGEALERLGADAENPGASARGGPGGTGGPERTEAAGSDDEHSDAPTAADRGAHHDRPEP